MRKITIFILLVGGVLVAGCSQTADDVQQIHERLQQMQSAAESKDLSALLLPVDDTFLGNQHVRKANLHGLAMLHFRQNRNVHILVNDIDAVLIPSAQGDALADVRFNLLMVGRNETLPERGRLVRVESRWQKKDAKWYVIRANWHDVLPAPAN